MNIINILKIAGIVVGSIIVIYAAVLTMYYIIVKKMFKDR